MSFIITINTVSELRQQFIRYNRDNFSNSGYQALLDYYEDLEDYELDVIDICSEWDESDIDTIINNYSIDLSDIINEDGDIDEAEKSDLVMEYLEDYTHVINCGNTYLFKVF